MSFSTRLKAVRESMDKSQSQLARDIGITPAAVGKFERGSSYPSLEVLIKIAQSLQCTTDYLLGLSNDAPISLIGEDVVIEPDPNRLVTTGELTNILEALADINIMQLVSMYKTLNEEEQRSMYKAVYKLAKGHQNK